jgi:short-subunit dehydrogenase
VITTSKTALITGATAGIGRELATLFAKDGYNLCIVARTGADLEQAARELQTGYGVEVTTIAKDLMEPDGAFEVCAEVDNMGLQIDVLVNNAGQGLYGQFVDTDVRRELAIVRLNIDATIVLTKHFLQKMVSRGEGRILNLASIASRTPGPWQSVYHATKAFVLSWTEAIRHEVKDTGVTITALMPGATDTDFFNKADMNESKMVQDKSSLDNAADVAKAGYEALMAGDDKVVAGAKNKMQVAMSNVTPDPVLAAQVDAQQRPVDGDK